MQTAKTSVQAGTDASQAAACLGSTVLIHDYIKSLPFGCVAGFGHVPAGQVLRSGRGDCHTKGTLFVALLRSAGLPARLRFVTLPSTFLRGIIDLGQNTITHAIGEVYLQDRWVQTDTYVTDAILEGRALALLQKENSILGYGVHASGKKYWDGQHDAHGQYASPRLGRGA
jgi:Transglutaminase-like superfamily